MAGLSAIAILATNFAPEAASAETSPPENADALERGEYLATAGNCMSCHTTADGDPFAGGVEFKTDFGSIYSTNITPHKEAGIGAWSQEQFHRAMRKGVRADGAHLYPAFPYPSYTNVTDEDISLIWAYLKTLPPSDQTATANELRFPYNQRWLLAGWKMIFLKKGPYEPDPDKSEQWNRGAYLTEGLAHCGSCHSPRNRFGAEIRKKAYSGGKLVERLGTIGPHRPWSAVNLTPSEAGLAEWTADDIASYLKTGQSKRAGVHGPMNEVIVNSTRHLTRGDIDSIAAYLTSLPPRGGDQTKPKPAQMKSGETLYDIYCGTCHLPTGLGIEGDAPPLAGNPIVNSEDPSTLINVVLNGAVKPHGWTPGDPWTRSMEPFTLKLRNEQVVSIANYIRGSWGNAAPPVTEEQVEELR